MRIVIIGAGLSGLTAAKVLKEQGFSDVLLLDKGRSAGGRLATRRIGKGKADHGAQFFTVRTEALKEEAALWLEQGWIKKWFGDPYPRYTGVEGMNSLAKKLAEQFDVKTETKVIRIQEAENGYVLVTEEGGKIRSEALIMTTPAPQAIELLEESGVDPGDRLKSIKFNPSFVALVTLKESLIIGDEGHIDQSLPDGLERIADHSLKGISAEPIASIYMTGEWSRNWYDQPSEEVIAEILKRAEPFVHPENIAAVQLKRWRFAEAVRPIYQPFIELENKHPLLIAGDAFLHQDDPAGRTRFESAFLSGKAAAEALAERLKKL